MKNKHKLPYAIIIGLDAYTGIQAARTLAFRGIPVIGIATDPKHPFSRTRVCTRKYFANTNNEEFIQLLEKISPELDRKGVLVPAHDRAVFLLSLNRQRLENWYHIVLPEHEIVETLMDKVKFTKFALENELPIPRTFIIKDLETLNHAASEVRYPCIIKPDKKTTEWLKETGKKVFMVYSDQELRTCYNDFSYLTELLIVQEWIRGEESNLFSFNGYFNKDSEPIATFIARKIRQWPPLIGVSASGVECRNDAVLEESVKLFQRADYYGLAYLEVKEDSEIKKPFIIEANIGRQTGRSSIAEAGGVELLYSMYCDTLGLELPAHRFQDYAGVIWIYLAWDILAALDMWSSNRLSVLEYYNSIKGPKAYAILSKRDPIPGILDLWKMKSILLKKVLSSLKKRVLSTCAKI